jgi:hypothetical protein
MHKPDPAKRLRQHPDDPNVWEYDVSYIRTLFPRTPCRGCPHGGIDRCGEPKGPERDCEDSTVWYGEHIEIANKLEGV